MRGEKPVEKWIKRNTAKDCSGLDPSYTFEYPNFKISISKVKLLIQVERLAELNASEQYDWT